MKIVIICIVLFISVPCFAWRGEVVKVADGDAIWVETETEVTKIRLYGIDAPEADQPYGAEATKFLSDLLLSQSVEVVDIEEDSCGQQVAIVKYGGMPVQAAIMATGSAWVYPEYCKDDICEYWLELEQMAREEGFGLWANDNAVEPWVWRNEVESE